MLGVVLEPGQVWLTQVSRRRSGVDVVDRTMLLLITEAHPDWEKPGLVRSSPRYGDLKHYTREVALDNLDYLWRSPLRRAVWSYKLGHVQNRVLQYVELIGVFT